MRTAGARCALTAPEVDPVDDSRTPEELAVAADEAFRLRVALDALPERERSVLGPCLYRRVDAE